MEKITISFNDIFTTDSKDTSGKHYIPIDEVDDMLKGIGKYEHIPVKKIVLPKEIPKN